MKIRIRSDFASPCGVNSKEGDDRPWPCWTVTASVSLGGFLKNERAIVGIPVDIYQISTNTYYSQFPPVFSSGSDNENEGRCQFLWAQEAVRHRPNLSLVTVDLIKCQHKTVFLRAVVALFGARRAANVRSPVLIGSSFFRITFSQVARWDAAHPIDLLTTALR